MNPIPRSLFQGRGLWNPARRTYSHWNQSYGGLSWLSEICRFKSMRSFSINARCTSVSEQLRRKQHHSHFLRFYKSSTMPFQILKRACHWSTRLHTVDFYEPPFQLSIKFTDLTLPPTSIKWPQSASIRFQGSKTYPEYLQTDALSNSRRNAAGSLSTMP
jgi:hypothetical protein